MKIARRVVTGFRVGFANAALPLAATLALLGAAPSMVQAQDTTSAIAGVAVPKGTALQSDAALQEGMGRAIADAAKLFELPARAGGPGRTESYRWQGADYKEGRALFLQTALKNTLTRAGYTYHRIDRELTSVPNLFDSDTYNNKALDMDAWDEPPAFFHATNVKERKTIVGVWLDQKSSKRVLLFIGETGFAGAPIETKIPEMTDPNVWLIKDLSDASKGMPVAALPPFAPMTAKPRTARGMVKDGSGKPIAGAHIVAQVTAAGGFYSLHEAKTNAQGIYEIPLPVGIARIAYADHRVTYNGQPLTLPLHPVDGTRDQFDGVKGHVENFVLRSSGATGASGGNYGGAIRVNNLHVPPSGTVEVTLTPTGPLMDGSKGKTLVLRYPVNTSRADTIVSGIPLGKYALSAKLYDGDEALPLQVRDTFAIQVGGDLPLCESLPIVFQSVDSERPPLGQSNVRRVEVTLQP